MTCPVSDWLHKRASSEQRGNNSKTDKEEQAPDNSGCFWLSSEHGKTNANHDRLPKGEDIKYRQNPEQFRRSILGKESKAQ